MFNKLGREAEAILWPLASLLVMLVLLYSLLKAAARYAPSPIATAARLAADAGGLDEDFDRIG
jgi:hypothetical protein